MTPIYTNYNSHAFVEKVSSSFLWYSKSFKNLNDLFYQISFRVTFPLTSSKTDSTFRAKALRRELTSVTCNCCFDIDMLLEILPVVIL